MVSTQLLAEAYNIFDFVPVVASDHCAGSHVQSGGNYMADVGAGFGEGAGHAGEGIV